MLRRLFLVALCGFFLAPKAGYGQNEVVSFRFGEHRGYVRFVLDMTENPAYRLLTLENPNRLVVDLSHTNTSPTLVRRISRTMPLIQKLRTGRHGDDLRIVLDLTHGVSIRSAFTIPPESGGHYRLVLDLIPELNNAPKNIPKIDSVPEKKIQQPAPPSPILRTTPPHPELLPSSLPKRKPEQSSATTIPNKKKSYIPSPVAKPKREPQFFKPLIIIDPGHGGQDPGATGRSGSYEKFLTLDYAKSLGKALESTGKYRAILTRYDDTFIRLDERVKLAKRAHGNLFISLHADSHPKARTRGLSVYTLSETASDKEAAALAAKANKSDVISSVNLEHQSDEVASILIDFVQRENQNASSRFAETLVAALKKKVRLLNNSHRFAGFRVLTSTDIPSALVELGYLSNSDEERLLQNPAYKKKLVNAMVQAIDKHFKEEHYFDTASQERNAF